MILRGQSVAISRLPTELLFLLLLLESAVLAADPGRLGVVALPDSRCIIISLSVMEADIAAFGDWSEAAPASGEASRPLAPPPLLLSLWLLVILGEEVGLLLLAIRAASPGKK